MVVKIGDDSFEKEIAQHKGFSLVDFYADWCGPCKQIAPLVEEIANEMSDKIKVCKINIDDNPETPSKFGIRSIPTLMIFQGGKVIATKMGSLPKSALVEWINSEIA